MKKDKSKKILDKVLKYVIPKRFKERISKSFELLYEDLPTFKDTLVPFSVTPVLWILHFMQVYIIAFALSVDISFFHFAIVYSISLVVAAIPISVGGLGTKDGALVILLSIFGISSAKAFSLSFIGTLVTMILPAVIGAVISFIDGNDRLFYVFRSQQKKKI